MSSLASRQSSSPSPQGATDVGSGPPLGGPILRHSDAAETKRFDDAIRGTASLLGAGSAPHRSRHKPFRRIVRPAVPVRPNVTLTTTSPSRSRPTLQLHARCTFRSRSTAWSTMRQSSKAPILSRHSANAESHDRESTYKAHSQVPTTPPRERSQATCASRRPGLRSASCRSLDHAWSRRS